MQGDFEKLKSLILSIEEEVKKAGSGNKAAGTRVRKAMQEVKNLAQEIRVDLLEKRDAGENRSEAAPPDAAAPRHRPDEKTE